MFLTETAPCLPEFRGRASLPTDEGAGEIGVIFVADTCVVVTPILPRLDGAVLMTNSGKFAHYAPGTTGYAVLYGSLAECVESAIAGRPVILDMA